MEAVPYIVEQRIIEAHHEKYDQYHILKLLVPFDLCIENIYSYQQYGKCTAVQVHTAVKLLALYRLSQDKHLLYHIPYASIPLPFREMSGGRRRGVKPDISRDQQKRRHSRSHDRCSRKLLDFCREQKITRIMLEVRENNEAARQFYGKCGFTKDGIRRNYYENPKENAVLMSVNL